MNIRNLGPILVPLIVVVFILFTLLSLKKKLWGRRVFSILLILLLLTTSYITNWPPFWPIQVKKANAAWYNVAWAKRRAITINHAQVAGSLTNFPIAIKFSNDSDLASNAKSDGSDIVFTSSDGISKLYHEIETYTSAQGNLIAWVTIPSLNTTTDVVIYMYYGNSGSMNQQQATSVWDTNYKAVYHFKEGTGTSVAESTTNNYTGTANGSPNWLTGVNSSPLGNSLHFNGSPDYVTNSSFSWPTGGNITVSYWNYNTTAETTVGGAAFGFSNTDNPNRVHAHSPWQPDGNLYWDYGDSTTTGRISTPYTIYYDKWTYITLVSSGTGNTFKAIYLNGVLANSAASSTGPLIALTGLDIARSVTTSTDYEKGAIDEMRISNTIRSAQWIQTEYQNQSNPTSFLNIAAAEARPAPVKVAFTNSAQTITAGTCSGAAKPLTLQLQDVNSSPSSPSASIVMRLSSDSPSETIYSDSSCSTPLTNGDITFTTADNSKTVYIIDTRKSASTWTLTASYQSGPGPIASTTQSITVNAGAATRLVVTLPGQTFTDGVGNSGANSTITAGSSFVLTKISATDDYFNVDPTYTGAKTLAYAGPSNAPDTTPPSYTTSVSFTTGQSTTTLTTTLFKAESTTITVTQAGTLGYASGGFTVIPGSVAASSSISPVTVSAATSPVNSNIIVTLTLKDTWQNPATNVLGTAITFNTTTSAFSLTRAPSDTNSSGVSTAYIQWSTTGSKTVIAVVSGTTLLSQPTVTVSAATTPDVSIGGGTKIKGGTKIQ